MDKVLEIGGWILANYQAVLSAVMGVLTALIALALLIPGDQPEGWFKAAADFLGKFSRKSDEPKSE